MKKEELIQQLDQAVGDLAQYKSIAELKPCHVCGSDRFKCVQEPYRVITIPLQIKDKRLYLGEAGGVTLLKASCACCEEYFGKFKALGVDAELAEARQEYQSRPE